ncbi:MAG TPA: TonB-dependent receptor [Gemmatimonadaceae bacterium]|nr:TonB-dependent receptor [Gemmatimonadaceae bacterium]
MRSLLLTASLALVARTAGAQAHPDSGQTAPPPRTVEPVVVTGTRLPVVIGSASAVRLRIDSLHLPPAPSLEQALRVVPFVGVRQNSRGEVELTMRGSDSRQVAVLLDGVPLTLGWDHRSDPSLLPLSGASSLTVVRGLASLLQGPNTLGGVVELDVAAAPSASARPDAALSLGGEAAGGRVATVSGGWPVRRGDSQLRLRAGLGWRDRPGVALAHAVGDTLTGDDRRSNSDLRQTDAFATARWSTPSGAWMGITAAGYDARRGVPPELHVVEPRLWREPSIRRGTGVLSAGTGVTASPFGPASLAGSVGLTAGSMDIAQYATAAFDEPVGRERGDERTATARAWGTQALGDIAQLAMAATIAEVRYDERLDEDPTARYRQRLWSVATEASAARGSARFAIGAALDGASTPQSGGRPALGARQAWAGRLGVSTLTGPGGRVRLHASLSSRARFPALRELYSGALGRFEPNPALRPERLVAGEAGATTQVGALQLQAVAFHHRLDDAVVRTTTPEGRFRRENRDALRTTGLELLADLGVRRATFAADLTLQQIRLRDAMLGATRRPEHQPNVRAGLEVAAPVAFGVVARAGARYVGRQWCVHPDLGRDVALDAQLRGDAVAERGWRVSDRGLLRVARATLALDNLGDAAFYDQCGLPQPGRTLRVGMELR